ncbi:sulfotransferase family 2 domain-containing protein [Sporomusa sp. KB1]|jgi:hypothetical protein|uniref:sulfotransferase family 2 domain-containing protein n=1 Tax=Sporomusa sp. KB1 TaxID=943346 RepID=UPI0011A3F4CC|nr:sulfotransferase family 2 domain-containing protein [Sporomusa sp. KB1]TWH45165.1 hypothetical protein Salpa_1068 [Sporomusa sp. KB1]
MTKEQGKNDKKKALKKHSVRSLVPGIANVSLPTIEDELLGKNADEMESKFNKAHQEIKRIISTWKKILYNTAPLELYDEGTEGFVQVTRAMHFDGKLRKQYEKLKNKKPLSQAEYDEMIDVLADAWALDQGMNEEEIRRFKQQIEELKADDCWDEMMKIHDQVTADLSKLDGLWNYEMKKNLLEDYKKIIYSELTEWRVVLNTYAAIEKKMADEAGIRL